MWVVVKDLVAARVGVMRSGVDLGRLRKAFVARLVIIGSVKFDEQERRRCSNVIYPGLVLRIGLLLLLSDV